MFQVHLYFCKLLFILIEFFVLYFFFEIIEYIFKATSLPYLTRYLATEILGLFFYLIIQFIRLNLLSTGNKTEIRKYIFYSFILSLPVIVLYLFYFYFQQFSLIFDCVICIMGFAFTAFEWIASFYAFIKIGQNSKYDEENI